MTRKPMRAAILSALFFGLGTPPAKILLKDIPPVCLAAHGVMKRRIERSSRRVV